MGEHCLPQHVGAQGGQQLEPQPPVKAMETS
jgi:hypothetical protein